MAHCLAPQHLLQLREPASKCARDLLAVTHNGHTHFRQQIAIANGLQLEGGGGGAERRVSDTGWYHEQFFIF